MKFPGSVLVSVVLFVAETAAALCLSGAYRAAGDRMWQWLTLLFALLPCALVQLSLVFIHRDVSRDRPLVLLLHLLQLGPLVRSVRDPPAPARGAEGSPGGGGGRRCLRAPKGVLPGGEAQTLPGGWGLGCCGPADPYGVCFGASFLPSGFFFFFLGDFCM